MNQNEDDIIRIRQFIAAKCYEAINCTKSGVKLLTKIDKGRLPLEMILLALCKKHLKTSHNFHFKKYKGEFCICVIIGKAIFYWKMYYPNLSNQELDTLFTIGELLGYNEWLIEEAQIKDMLRK